MYTLFIFRFLVFFDQRNSVKPLKLVTKNISGKFTIIPQIYIVTLFYFHIVYNILSSMSTVGFGDITSSNSTEQLFSILIMLFGSFCKSKFPYIVFGYITGTISNLLNSGPTEEEIQISLLLELSVSYWNRP